MGLTRLIPAAPANSKRFKRSHSSPIFSLQQNTLQSPLHLYFSILTAPHFTFLKAILSHSHAGVWLIFTYTLLSVMDMASSVRASLDTSLSLVLLTGAKEPTWPGLSASPRLYDLRRERQQTSDRHKRNAVKRDPTGGGRVVCIPLVLGVRTGCNL